MRSRVPLCALHLRHVVRLRAFAQERRLIVMDARALVDSLTGERARFVRMARRRVATEADAEDLVQRALLRAAERAGSLTDPSRARAWFYRILRRTIVDHHRAKTPEASDVAVDTLEATDTADATPITPCKCAVHLLAELRPAYAEIVRRIDFEGEDAATVATALRLSSSNLYVRLHRARHALRDRVEKHCGVSSVAPCLDCMCNAHDRCGS